jgi:thiamine-phosphate pyrophosphorylase
MKLVIITPARDIEDEQSLVTKMFESGLQTLHLRKPRYSTNRLKEYIKLIPEHFHDRIVVHTHHDLALKFKLKGIHLGKIHLSKRWRYFFVRFRLRLRFDHVSKSRSYSRLQQLFAKEERTYDYFLLGTMFNTMTGELYSGFYEAGLTNALKTSGKKIIARGGTTASSIEKAKRYGFAGIAFNSYLWSAEQPYEKFLKILQEFERLEIELE